MQLTANLKNTAPGLEKALPAFSKGSDGTADFGGRYNPITGAPALSGYSALIHLSEHRDSSWHYVASLRTMLAA